MSARKPKKQVEAPPQPAPGDDEEIASLPENPELEAALAAAAAAVPDPGAREEAPAGDAEVPVEDSGAADAPEDEERDLHREVTSANERLVRLQADFVNFRKRASRERLEALQYGPQNLVKDLLSVVDNLERAIDHAQKSEGGDLQSLLQGVELVQREFLGALANHHVSEIDAIGKPFDPSVHEAMAQVERADTEPNTVIEVFQKGYQLRDRLVRPSRVVVAKEPDEGGEGEATD